MQITKFRAVRVQIRRTLSVWRSLLSTCHGYREIRDWQAETAFYKREKLEIFHVIRR